MAAIPGAVPVPFPGGGGAVALPPSTYVARFSEAANDIYAGDYTALALQHSAEAVGGVAVVPHNTLFSQLVRDSAHPTTLAVALLVPSATGERVVRVYTCVQRYHDRPGTPATPYHDGIFATQGDVEMTDGIITFATAGLPENIFTRTPLTRVPSLVTVDAAIGALADPEDNLGPFAAADADTEEKRTRFAVVLPGPLAAMCIGRDLTPLVFWNTVVAHIRATPVLMPACTYIVEWGLLARTVDATDVVANLCATAPNLVASTGAFNRARIEMLKRDLPGLRPGGPNSMVAIAQAMGGIAAAQNQQTAAAHQARLDATAPKKAGDRFKNDQLRLLLEICEVVREEDLPPVYDSLAQNPKKEDLKTAQRALDKTAAQRSSFSPSGPVLTTGLLDVMLEPHYDARDADDLEDGVTPWRTLSLGVDHHTALRQMASLAMVLHTGGQTVTLSDVLDLKQMEKGNFTLPLKYRHAFRSLGSYQILLDTFLGPHHRLSQALRASLTLAMANEEALEEKLDRSPLAAAHTLRWFALRLNQFFRQHRLATVATSVALPPLSEMWNDVLIENWRAPSLPPRYMLAPAPLPSVTPSLAGTDSSKGTQMSDLTPATGGGPSVAPKGKVRDRAVFHAPDDELVNLAGENWRSDVVKKELSAEWPTLSSGKLLCLPWWTKKGCFQACKRCHADTLDPGDRKTTVDFLEKHFAKYRKN
jgi:hypothetical protein